MIDFERADLIVQPGAIMHNDFGDKEPARRRRRSTRCCATSRAIPPAAIRAVASRWIDGHILGPFSWLGRDQSDGNDRYRHEERRDLRGFGVFAAWIDDVDVIENNTLDSYVGRGRPRPRRALPARSRRLLRRFSAAPKRYWMSDQSYFQADRIARVAAHRRAHSAIAGKMRAGSGGGARSSSSIPSSAASPPSTSIRATWRPIVDIPRVRAADRRDRYWGAKRVASFSRDELAAVVATAHYRPAAAAFLTEALWQRRERIARDAFAETAALDHFAVDGTRLCFTDWWLRAGLGGAGGTSYVVREEDRVVATVAAADDRACATLPARDGYRVLTLSVIRPGERHAASSVAVHLVSRAGRARIVGVLH